MNGPNDYYKHGDWNVECSMCGRKRKSGDVVKNWQGMWRCPEHNEPRHPQDFAKGSVDKMTVPFAQPPPADIFVYTCSIPGASAVPLYATPGCMMPGRALVPGYVVTPEDVPTGLPTGVSVVVQAGSNGDTVYPATGYVTSPGTPTYGSIVSSNLDSNTILQNVTGSIDTTTGFGYYTIQFNSKFPVVFNMLTFSIGGISSYSAPFYSSSDPGDETADPPAYPYIYAVSTTPRKNLPMMVTGQQYTVTVTVG